MYTVADRALLKSTNPAPLANRPSFTNTLSDLNQKYHELCKVVKLEGNNQVHLGGAKTIKNKRENNQLKSSVKYDMAEILMYYDILRLFSPYF